MWASQVALVVKSLYTNAGDVRNTGSVPELGRFPWRRAWQPTTHSVLLPGEFHGQRSLVGYSPWGPKESDTTEWLTLSLAFMAMTDFTLVKDERTYRENGICMHLGRSGPRRNIEMLSPDNKKDGEQPKRQGLRNTSSSTGSGNFLHV